MNTQSIIIVCHSANAPTFLAVGFTLRLQLTTGAVVLSHRATTGSHAAAAAVLQAAAQTGMVFYGRSSGDQTAGPSCFAAIDASMRHVRRKWLHSRRPADQQRAGEYRQMRARAARLIHEWPAVLHQKASPLQDMKSPAGALTTPVASVTSRVSNEGK